MKTGAVILCVTALTLSGIGADRENNRLPRTSQMNRITFGNSLPELFVEDFRQLAAAREKKIQALKTRADAENFVRTIQCKVRQCVHLPAEKCDLNARVTGKTEFPDFVMEKVLFQSRPGFTVSANFYLPRNWDGKNKLPAILFQCGHSSSGKAYSAYQYAVRGLAQRGFAVLAFDPIGQGERRQFTRIRNFKPDPTEEHILAGKQLLAVGEDLFSWMVWDAIRALDYLESRPEVDPKRIGAHGNSGGGTLSIWLAAIDDRVSWTAPASSVTTWLHNVENEMPGDLEQIPIGTAKLGLEYPDFLIATAPRSLMLLGQANDFFDPRGLEETLRHLKKIYRLLGHPERIGCFIGSGSHGLSSNLREHAYNFFCRSAGIKNPQPKEGKIIPGKKAELNAAPGGSVYNLPGEKHVYQLLKDKISELKKNRPAQTRAELGRQLKTLLKIKAIARAPYFRRLSYRYYKQKNGYQNYSRFGLETEPGRVMSVLHRSAKKELYYAIHKIPGKTFLYIPNLDSAEELQLREPEPGDALYSLDYRGIGECLPTAVTYILDDALGQDIYYYYGAEYHFTSLYLLKGESLCGKRVEDILAALELIGPASSSGKVILEARGFGCIPALIAALISDRVAEIKLTDCPESWEKIALAPLAGHREAPVSALPYNILSCTDIPEIIRTLKKAGIPVTVK